MAKLFRFSFLIHGLISLVAQVVILRELMIAFYGNELFMATTLGFWLLGAGLGSWLSHKFSPKKISPQNLLALNLFLVALIIPLEIFLIRFFKGRFFLPGEVPNFLTGLGLSFFLLFPFCFILNAFFTLGTRFFSRLKKKEKENEEREKKSLPRLVSSAYLWETLGLAGGGLLFNFFLINLPEFKTALFLSGLSFFLSFSFASTSWFKKSTLFLSLLVVLLALSPLSPALNQQTLKLVHPNFLEAVNSKYGRITVTQSAGQYNFFESGGLVGTEQDLEASEYLTHFTLSFHPQPQKILLIGGGFNGVISELLKYPTVKKIDYVELDPLFLKTIEKHLPPKLREALTNPRVKINYLDARRFLKKTKEKYDFVLFLLPNPGNTLLNRFYTQECFQEVKSRLNREGIFVFSLSVPVDYLSEEAEKLVSSLYWTGKSVFPEVLVFPETDSLFLAANQALSQDPEILTGRFQRSNIKTSFITSEYFYYRTKSDHVDRFKRIFQGNQDVKTNLDFSPTAYFYQITFWQTQFSFRLAKLFNELIAFKWSWAVLLLCFPFLVLLRQAKKSLSLAPVAVGVAGFTLMVFETLTIFTFQATLGFLFAKIALVFTALLVSMGIGNLWATRRLDQAPKKIKTMIFLLTLYGPAYLLFLKQIDSELGFYLLAAVVGFLVGTIFPFANQIFLQKDKKAAWKTGLLYSTDLLGAFLGAILTSVFLIPLLGVQPTICFLTAINFLLFLFLKKDLT